jgi:hypothetical protein
MTPQVAFLFLTRHDLVHDRLWRAYFAGQEGRYAVYCHPSDRSRPLTGVLAGRAIAEAVQTSWGATAFAVQALLRAALRDPRSTKFVLCSESCVPMRRFEDTYAWLSGDDRSHVKLDLVDDRIRRERDPDTRVPDAVFRKHAANYALSRTHAGVLAATPRATMAVYQDMPNGDEHVLSLLWAADVALETVADTWVVYSDWDHTRRVCDESTRRAHALYETYKAQQQRGDQAAASRTRRAVGKAWAAVHAAARHPRLYEAVTPALAETLRAYPFARKFAPGSNIGDHLDWAQPPGPILGDCLDQTAHEAARQLRHRGIATPTAAVPATVTEDSRVARHFHRLHALPRETTLARLRPDAVLLTDTADAARLATTVNQVRPHVRLVAAAVAPDFDFTAFLAVLHDPSVDIHPCRDAADARTVGYSLTCDRPTR